MSIYKTPFDSLLRQEEERLMRFVENPERASTISSGKRVLYYSAQALQKIPQYVRSKTDALSLTLRFFSLFL